MIGCGRSLWPVHPSRASGRRTGFSRIVQMHYPARHPEALEGRRAERLSPLRLVLTSGLTEYGDLKLGIASSPRTEVLGSSQRRSGEGSIFKQIDVLWVTC